MRSDQYIQAVLSKCESLTRAGLWSPAPKIRTNAWLNNFEEEEQPTAAILLDHFVYFSSAAVDRMLSSAYRQLRDGLIRVMGKAVALDVLENAIFTSVEGEDPNVTDSGKLFCRKLRQTLGLREERFVEPADAFQHAKDGRAIIFLDDLLGSGIQFHKTWKRHYSPTYPYSFENLEESTSLRAYYLVLVATVTGVDRLRADVPAIKVVAAHIANNANSAHSLPRNALRPELPDIPSALERLIAKYTPDLRLPAYLTTESLRKYGHGQLGLLLAFEHSTPDSTLPLFWAESLPKWTPLVRRT